MNFKNFSDLVNAKFQEMQKRGKLFISSLSGNELWEIYINSFKKEDNGVFRDPESTVNNCNLDNHFIRRYGNIVSLNENNEIQCMWDLELSEDSPYYLSAKAMTKALKEAPIADMFMEEYCYLQDAPYERVNKSNAKFRLGIELNHKIYSQAEVDKFGVVTPDKPYVFYHFYADLDKQFVNSNIKSVDALKGDYRDSANVMKRGLNEIPLDTLELVKDLILQDSILNGTSYLQKLDNQIELKKKYDAVKSNKENWVWNNVSQFSRFRNELIGVLCTDLAEGVELNKACSDWNKRVDPVNFMKAKAPITEAQRKRAEKFIVENGYLESFDRRFATIDDIKVSEVLHATAMEDAKKVTIFDNVKTATSTRHKRSQFDGVEEMSIEKFMSDVLPRATAVELFMENKFANNFVAMTTSKDADSKQIMKWDNNYSWTYINNLAGKSFIAETVKSFGGKVDGKLRCSLMWAYKNDDRSDLDLHCLLFLNRRNPVLTERIYFVNKSSQYNKGMNLDVDIINPNNDTGAVENIICPENPIDGIYKFVIRPFNRQNSRGFKAEIVFDGEAYTYSYNGTVTADIDVATITVTNGQMTIEHHLPAVAENKKTWGIESGDFAKVNLACLSPNYWGENAVGNKHYFFMLDGCKSDVALRGFHAENLISELHKERAVLDVLAGTCMIEPDNKHLAGVGFNATVREEAIFRVSGTHKRVIKVKF